MRALVTTLPMLSHLRAAFPFAQRLVQAGHEVHFATSARAVGFARAAGFEASAVGAPWLIGRQDVPGGPDLPDPGKHVLRDQFLRFSARRMLPDVLALARRLLPDVILRTTMEHAGEIAADVLGLPQITIQNHAYYPPSWLEHHAGEAMHDLRSEHGLARTTAPFASGYRYACLSVVPRSFHYYRDIPETMHVFRPSFDERAPDFAFSGAAPRVHVFLGSTSASLGAFKDYRGLVTAFIDALADAPYHASVVLAAEEDPAEYPHAPNVHVRAFDWREPGLPLCDLLVCHGGLGTVTEAISRGVPVLATPRGADQHSVARSCEASGIGRVLRPLDGITPGLVRATLQEMLADRSHVDRMKRMQRELLDAPPIDDAVPIIETVARERRPIGGVA
jgi:MGT family glycosyltransferase